jgi:putative endonuclease
LANRLTQHRSGVVPGFARDYGCTTLVWFEWHDTIDDDRLREWRMKKWKRAWKIELVERDNPQWRDLALTLDE